ncbi:uncharacterized protein L3040_004613 [Drepanopeziza brunnea f. sp. 'multigermtubi']|uniref:Uncharacterized protein n=1 Tax=Marssonina brunnea f. sp. multigermtubi (strain MB_m1) TaxID=1072389 RepID=K1Y735_MARBU|nr:uncharacterized protein MBM_00107 [Drepanopeziza brunnea f. sp. 'multigermtubi' MB_m1]EKD20994.1 hypothetical protein MBM_00107 [Drepanopeziza brunnea f. sp. 'multigermtubi' MB_m1]KAJ5042054.1 hypothetical protein L3040_004613 [Drepanopeziza brunnea f. sp. 'multigermtubi']
MCRFTTTHFSACTHVETETQTCHLTNVNRFPRVTPCFPQDCRPTTLVGQCFDCRSGYLTHDLGSRRAPTYQKTYTGPAPRIFGWDNQDDQNEERWEPRKQKRNTLRDRQLNRVPGEGFAAGYARLDLPNQRLYVPERKATADDAARQAIRDATRDLTRDILSRGITTRDEGWSGRSGNRHPDLPTRTTVTDSLGDSARPAAPTPPRVEEPETIAQQPWVDDRLHKLKNQQRIERVREGAQDARTPQNTNIPSEIRRMPLSFRAAEHIRRQADRKEEATQAWSKRQPEWTQHKLLVHTESKELFLPTITPSDVEKRRQADRTWKKAETAVDDESRRKAAELWANLLKSEQQLVHSKSKELFLPTAVAALAVPEAERRREATEAWENMLKDQQRQLVIKHSASKELFLPSTPRAQDYSERTREATAAWENTERSWASHRPMIHTVSKELFLTMTPTHTHNLSEMKDASELSRISMMFETAFATAATTTRADTGKLEAQLDVNSRRGTLHEGSEMIEVKYVYELPNVEQLPMMTFDGTCLEIVTCASECKS